MSAVGLQRYPFLRLLIPLVGGILCGDALPYALPSWLLWTGGGVLLTLLVACHCRRWGYAYGATAFLFLAGLGYALTSLEWRQTDYDFPGEPAVYKVRIVEKPEPKERSILCRSVLLEACMADSVRPEKGTPLFLLYFPKDSVAATLRRGDELLVHATLSPPMNNGNPDEFDYVRFLRRRGGSGTAYVPADHWQVVGHDSVRTWKQAALDCRDEVVGLYRRLGFKGDELAVLSALTVGDQDELSDDIVETYSVSGASHVLALSGLHIGFLYALFWFLFSLAWRHCRWLKFWLVALIVVLLWVFAFITGLSSSVVRSVTMFSLLALSGLQLEKLLTLNTLAATAFLMLLWHPFWLFDVGFQLSFLAVVAIVLIQPKLYALWKVDNRVLRYVWGLATVSVSAQLATAPLVLLYFSRFSTHFLLTNLWVVPVSSLLMYAAVVLLALTPLPAVQQLFAVGVERLVWLQNRVLQLIEDFPYSSIDNVWVDKWEALLFYVLIGAVCTMYVKHTARSVFCALSVLLVLVSWHAIDVWHAAPQRSLYFYNVRGCPAVHCLAEGSRSWLVCADSVPDVSRLERSLSPYWNHLRLEAPRVVCGEQPDGPVSLCNGVATYAGKRVCFLRDHRWRGLETDSPPLPVDYLYVCRGYKGNIAELAALFSIKAVVFEPSYSKYYRELIIRDCIQLGIPYWEPDVRGGLRVLL